MTSIEIRGHNRKETRQTQIFQWLYCLGTETTMATESER